MHIAYINIRLIQIVYKISLLEPITDVLRSTTLAKALILAYFSYKNGKSIIKFNKKLQEIKKINILNVAEEY